MNAQAFGLVWFNGKQRYFRDYRRIKAWKGQKRVVVVIGNKEIKFNINAIKRWPNFS